MSENTKLWISLPTALLTRLDQMAQSAGVSRDDALRQAVETFLQRSFAPAMERWMAEGYTEMGEINLTLASEGEDALSEWGAYERMLAEADVSGDS